jgi:hypothetical protein
MIIEAGTPLRIIAVQGNRVIVRRHTPGDTPPTTTAPKETPPLDFDLS